jgi:hypothetical protein
MNPVICRMNTRSPKENKSKHPSRASGCERLADAEASLSTLREPQGAKGWRTLRLSKRPQTVDEFYPMAEKELQVAALDETLALPV